MLREFQDVFVHALQQPGARAATFWCTCSVASATSRVTAMLAWRCRLMQLAFSGRQFSSEIGGLQQPQFCQSF